MRILFIGDIVGKPGRVMVERKLPPLIEEEGLDLVIANAENAAGGSGLTPQIYRALIAAGVDAITLGDHVYKRKEICPILTSETNIVRPANLPPQAAGAGWNVVQARNGTPVAFTCLLGQLFMRPADSPYQAIDRILLEIPSEIRIRFVDFHAEATSEKQLLGRYVDGRVTALLGTHTHVPTADETILPNGTAFQCDVGMTGPYESIIGRRIDRVMRTTITAHPNPFDVATGDLRLSGTIFAADPETGKAVSIRRVCIREA